MTSKSTRPIESTADLARYLNVSQWTVSRAINGHKDVSEETRKRVFEAMEECGFQPNLHARRLRGQATKVIGICFRNFSIPIVNIKLMELQRVLRRYGFHYIYETTIGNAQREINVIRDFQRLGVDGIVNINSLLNAAQLEEHLAQTPCVLVESTQQDTGRVAHVTLDREKAMREILMHLHGLGHRRFALIGIGKSNQWRWDPLVRITRELGMDPDEALMATSEYKEMDNYLKGGRKYAEEFLKLPEAQRPKALICLDDLVATGVIQTFIRKGIRVPEDYSVTGFNNEEISQELYPAITTIDQNPRKLMERAGVLLVKFITEKAMPGYVELVTPELLVRESTAPISPS